LYPEKPASLHSNALSEARSGRPQVPGEYQPPVEGAWVLVDGGGSGLTAEGEWGTAGYGTAFS